jgi:hypothetical protein
MSYENLVMQNVVASVEATDDIPRRFITFMRGLVERPEDFHFKFGERTCKIATLKSQFAVDNGGCAGHLVIETESEHHKESRLGFKLTRGTGNSGTRLTLTFNPSQLLAGDGVAPTLRRDPSRWDDDESAPEFPSSSQFVTAKLLGLGFDVLNDLYEAKHKRPLIYYTPPFNDGDIRLERVDWDALIQTKDPREFLLFLVLLYEPVFTANDDGRPLRLADLLKLKTSCGFDPRAGELTRVTFTRLQGKRRKLCSVEFSKLESSAAADEEEEDFASASPIGWLRLRVTAHPTGIVQLIREANWGCPTPDDDQSMEFDENDDTDMSDGGERSDRDAFAVSTAIDMLWQAHDRGQPLYGSNYGTFGQWLVAKTLRDTLRLDVVGGFEQQDVEALAADTNEVARAWADGGIGPMNFKAWAQAANLDYEKARRYRNSVRDDFKIDIGVPRAFYDGVTVAAAGAMDPNALRALAGALAKDDPMDAGGQLIAAAKRFAEGRRKVIGATVEAALAGRLGDFPVKEVSGEIEALPPRNKRSARKVAPVLKSIGATKQSKPGVKARNPAPFQPPRGGGRKSAPTTARENKRAGSTIGKRLAKR